MLLTCCGIKCLNDAFTEFPNIIDCTQGIIFLSTPQRTSPGITWATLLLRCARDSIRVPPGSTRAELSYLQDPAWAKRSGVVLYDIAEGFKAKATKRTKLLFCYEDVPTSPQQECVSFNSQALMWGVSYTNLVYRV